MFRVIKIEGKLKLELNPQFVVAVEYVDLHDVTLVYCFTTSSKAITILLDTLKLENKAFILPETYHDVYLKNYYYDHELIISIHKTNIKLFTNHHFINNKFSIFFETKIKRKRIAEKIEYTTVEELRTILVENFGIKYLVPFFYSIREMKELMGEKRIKVKDLNLLYLVENKTLEGKKR